jgi:hypothetical protein
VVAKEEVVMKMIAAVAAAGLAVSAAPALAARVHLVVKPARVPAGGRVTVTAASSPCLPVDTVTLISKAFRGRAFGGEGAVTGAVGRRGSFAVTARIRRTLRPGRYLVTARCGGGNLPSGAVIRVVRSS